MALPDSDALTAGTAIDTTGGDVTDEEFATAPVLT
jgi:hypothetical protein